MTTPHPPRDAVATARHRGRIAVAVVCSIMVALGLLSAGVQWRNAQAIDAGKRSDEIASCRSVFRLELIDAPQLETLKAIAEGDEEARDAALARADVDGYRKLNRLSITDPDRFLRECRAATP